MYRREKDHDMKMVEYQWNQVLKEKMLCQN